MYDIEVVVPVHYAGKYVDRIDFFKRVGLNNIGDKKVLLNLLTGTLDVPDIDKGWGSGIDVNVIKSNKNHVASKVCFYYANMKLNHYVNARWFLRVDDDSVTDISSIIDQMEKTYKWEDPVYCGTELNSKIEPIDLNILNDMELLDNEYNEGKIILPVYHEWEGCIISQETLRRVLENKQSVEFMKRRSNLEGGYCDIPFAIAARISDVHVTCCPYMSKRPELLNFSAFGGTLSHIHQISPDMDSGMLKIILSKITKSESENDCPLLNKNYILCKETIEEFITNISLKPDGTINSPKKDQFSFWSFDNETLKFYNPHGIVCVEFDRTDNFSYLVGRSNVQNQIRVIREVLG